MRLRKKDSSLTLYCFSPPVMVLTFVVEMTLTAYTYLRFKAKEYVVITVALLCCLAIFQVAEFHICVISSTPNWARLGYVAITLLPPLGIHLVTLVNRNSALRLVCYLVAFVMIALFFMDPIAVHGAICQGNYVILSVHAPVDFYFKWYYTIFLLVGIAEAMRCIYVTPEKARRKRAVRRNLLTGLIAGYLIFILPTGIAYLVNSEVMMAIPSVMCGFAVLMALIIVFYVLPLFRQLEKQ
jgi:hypothetical protein